MPHCSGDATGILFSLKPLVRAQSDGTVLLGESQATLTNPGDTFSE